MKAIWQLASLAVCFVALSGCDVVHIAAQSAQARGGFERTLTVNGPVDLYVRTGSGSIQVRTGSADRVQIIGRVTASAWRDSIEPAERVKRVEVGAADYADWQCHSSRRHARRPDVPQRLRSAMS